MALVRPGRGTPPQWQHVDRVVWLDTPAGALRVEDDAAGPVLSGTTTGSIWQEVVAALRADPVHTREQTSA